MDVKSLSDTYFNWIKKKIKFTDHETFVEVQTPYVDMFHDYISLVVEKTQNGYIISDDGYALDELDSLGIDLNRSKKRKEYFNQTLQNFGVSLNDKNELSINFQNLGDFPKSQNRLTQCMIQVCDMLNTSRKNTNDLFVEDVVNYLLDENLAINTNASYLGVSGHDMNFEVLIGRTKRTNAKAIKLINNPVGNSYIAPLFAINDVKPLNESLDFYILANDLEKEISPNFRSAVSNYKIPLLEWSNKENWVSELQG